MGKCDEDPTATICSSDLVPRDYLSDEQLRTLRLVSKCKNSINFVCGRHLKEFYHDFAWHQVKCCDPFGTHGSNPPPAKKAKKQRSLHIIDLDLREKAKKIGLNLIPQKKLCVTYAK